MNPAGSSGAGLPRNYLAPRVIPRPFVRKERYARAAAADGPTTISLKWERARTA